ncbi:MAG TPA: hypothetical protein VFW13_11710 [Phenylobacterium sp.]|nr:hypothetical protein [Phenylobacterium sp.]
MSHAPTSSPIQPQDPPGSALLRRRVIIELRPDELPLLTAAQERHGTKRAAIVAALRAEARVEDVEAALARHSTERAQLEARLADTTKAAATEKARLAKERDAALAKADKSAKAVAGHKTAATRTAREAAGEAERLRGLLDRCDTIIAELESRVVDWAYCARCHTWAPRHEWAWEAEDDGEYAYHQPCGDHGPGVLDASSRLVWQQAEHIELG